MSQVDLAAIANEPPRGTAIGDRDKHTGRGRISIDGRVDGHADLAADRIKPGGSGHFVRIESAAIGHQLATVLLAVPGSDNGGFALTPLTSSRSGAAEDCRHEQSCLPDKFRSFSILANRPEIGKAHV